jgi:hypothetical protein
MSLALLKRGDRIRKATQPTDPLLASLWREYGQDLEAVIVEAVAETMGETVLGDVREALQNGAIDDAMAAIPWDEVGAELLHEAVPAILAGALETSGNDAAAGLTNKLSQADGSVSLGFSISAQDIAGWIRDTSDNVIRYLTAEQRDGIARVVQAVTQDGLDAARAAKLIRDGDLVGLTPRDVNAVFNFLQSQADAGVGLGEMDQRAILYTQRLLDQRASLIARTEMSRANTQGKLAMWAQAQQAGHIGAGAMKEWLAEGDNPCPECEDLDGEMVPLEAQFTGGYDGPPDPHPACQCSMEVHAFGE